MKGGLTDVFSSVLHRMNSYHEPLNSLYTMSNLLGPQDGNYNAWAEHLRGMEHADNPLQGMARVWHRAGVEKLGLCNKSE